MSEFMQFVFRQLQNSLVLVLFAGIAAAGVLAVIWLFYKRKYHGERKFPWGKTICWLLLAGYGLILLYATLLRSSGGFREVNLHLFRAWREAWNNFSAKTWGNLLLNIALFVPLGVLLPLVGKPFRKWQLTIPAGFALSLTIELVQLGLGRGICDVDDLLANALGAAVGYFAVMAVLSAGKKHRKPAVLCACLALVPALAVGGTVLVYHLQPYGNLPMAMAYTNDTGDTAWALDCKLPQIGDTAAVYRAQAMSRADCDAFAAEMAAITGTKIGMTSYYQGMAYYHLTQGVLWVNYYDGSYEFFQGYEEIGEAWPAADRETVEQALDAFPVMIPETAEFADEGDGWYRFTCDKQIDGAVMMDGTLRCRYEGNTIVELENGLVWYTYYNNTPIISAETAYERLCAGKFYDGGFFEYNRPADVQVFGCRLDYEIDTKGFYQPVWRFDVASTESSYHDCIMIPAIP